MPDTEPDAVVSIPANRRALFSVSKALEAGDDLVEREPREPLCDKSLPNIDTDHEMIEIKTVLKEVMQNLGASGSASTRW